MTFESPTPLAEAIRLLLDKRLVPTALSSAELRELAAEVKQAALFSARMTQLRPLEVLQQVLEEMLRGGANMADAKLALGKVYEAMGYDAEAGGFPQDAPGTVPPALRGSLRDLASQERMALTIETNYRMVTNAAFVANVTADDQRRYQWPCFELVRIGPRRTPRGFVRRKGGMEVKPGDDWPSRWEAAGGELYDRGTRMIATKDSPVWQALGAGEGGYKDTLGNAFPPFAFSSGMGLREISREEALTIGVIGPEDEIAKVPTSLQPALKKQAEKVRAKFPELFDDIEEDTDRIRRQQERWEAAEAARMAARRNRRLTWLADVLNRGTRAGALQGWITRRRGKLLAGEAWDHTHPRERFMRGAIRPGVKIPFKRVDSAEAARVKASTGYDVQGKYHVLDDEHVRHVHKQHGDARAEARRGQHAVRREHLVRLHQLHSSPSSVTTFEGIDPKSRLPRIKTVGRVGRRRIEHVEEIHDEYLLTVTMHVHNRRGAVVADTAPAREAPTGTPGSAHSNEINDQIRARCKLFAALLQKGVVP